jgi:hypothetical protein
MVTGSSSSGKTALLAKILAWPYLHDNVEALPRPLVTKEITHYSIDLGHMDVNFVEIPGKMSLADEARMILETVDAVIFTVDSANKVRLQQSQ